MQVMLLAAGRSTRLGALGVARPKPLVPICGHPAITFGLHLLCAGGTARWSSTCTTTASRSAPGGRRFGVRVLGPYSRRPTAGDGGGISHARPLVFAGTGAGHQWQGCRGHRARGRSSPPIGLPQARGRPWSPLAHPDRFAPVSVDSGFPGGRAAGPVRERSAPAGRSPTGCPPAFTSSSRAARPAASGRRLGRDRRRVSTCPRRKAPPSWPWTTEQILRGALDPASYLAATWPCSGAPGSW